MNCPECGQPMLATHDASGRTMVPVWLCPARHCVLPRVDDKELEKRRNAPAPAGRSGGAGSVVAAKLPHLDPGRQFKTLNIPEKAIQQNIVTALKREGYLVMETSEKRARVGCPSCGKWFTPFGGRPGLTIGLPDLYARNQSWPGGVWVGLEVKGAKTAVREQQKFLAEGEHIYMVRSTQEALHIVHSLDKRLNRNGDYDVVVPSNPTEANVEARK